MLRGLRDHWIDKRVISAVTRPRNGGTATVVQQRYIPQTTDPAPQPRRLYGLTHGLTHGPRRPVVNLGEGSSHEFGAL